MSRYECFDLFEWMNFPHVMLWSLYCELNSKSMWFRPKRKAVRSVKLFQIGIAYSNQLKKRALCDDRKGVAHIVWYSESPNSWQNAETEHLIRDAISAFSGITLALITYRMSPSNLRCHHSIDNMKRQVYVPLSQSKKYHNGQTSPDMGSRWCSGDLDLQRGRSVQPSTSACS